jgi:hypothetical protein
MVIENLLSLDACAGRKEAEGKDHTPRHVIKAHANSY